MTLTGSAGDTEAQRRDTLQYDLSQDRLHSTFNALDFHLVSRVSRDEEGEFGLTIDVPSASLYGSGAPVRSFSWVGFQAMNEERLASIEREYPE